MTIYFALPHDVQRELEPIAEKIKFEITYTVRALLPDHRDHLTLWLRDKLNTVWLEQLRRAAEQYGTMAVDSWLFDVLRETRIYMSGVDGDLVIDPEMPDDELEPQD